MAEIQFRGQSAAERRDADGQRLYNLLALFDTRDGSLLADIVRAAREGWERSHPDMGPENNAWDEFDRRFVNYQARGVGWTHDEVMAAPAAVARLHRAVLDLEDEIERLRVVMGRAASERDEAMAAYDSAENELQRQYLQGVAGALDGVLRDYASTSAKTPERDSGE